ncbi:MAG: DUF1573 domain-containing protein [Planctomycetaceae bacterium]|nr:DUF1573 domain-containing protein [Planctomycetaceae bacterium]
MIETTNKTIVLSAKPNTLDFGTVKPGIYVGEILLFNSSDVPMEVLSVTKSCTCTEIVFPRGKIQPKKSSILACRFNTSDIEGLHQGQVLVEYIPKKNNIQKTQYLLVTIQATVSKE